MNQKRGSDKPNKFKFFMKGQRFSTLDELRKVYSFDDEDLPRFLTLYQMYFGHQENNHQIKAADDGNWSNGEFTPTGQLVKDMSVGQYLLQSNNTELLNLSWSLYPPNCWQLAAALSKVGLISQHFDIVRLIQDGSSSLIEALVGALSHFENVTLQRNSKVAAVTQTKLGFSVNMATKDKEYRCQKVVLACSKNALTNIAIEGSNVRKEKITRMLNSVSSRVAFKLYLTYRRPWWEDYGLYQGVVMTDLPMHMTMALGERGKSDSYASILAAFSHEFIEIFRGLDLDRHDRFVNIAGDVNKEMIPSKLLVDNVQKQLKEVLGECSKLITFKNFFFAKKPHGDG